MFFVRNICFKISCNIFGELFHRATAQLQLNGLHVTILAISTLKLLIQLPILKLVTLTSDILRVFILVVNANETCKNKIVQSFSTRAIFVSMCQKRSVFADVSTKTNRPLFL